jgi:hypothetical protein
MLITEAQPTAKELHEALETAETVGGTGRGLVVATAEPHEGE